MANVGEVNATFRAKVSGFVQPVQVVKGTVKQLEKQLRDVNAILAAETVAFKEGRVSVQEYQRSVGSLQAQADNLRRSLFRMESAQKGVNTSMVKGKAAAIAFGGARRGSGLNMVRSGMAQVAVMSLHTKSAIGQVAQGLLLLGPGAPAVIAAAAGIAAIAFAYSKLTEKSREARESLDRMADTFERRFNPRKFLEPLVAIAKADVALAATRLQAAREGRGRTGIGGGGGITGGLPVGPDLKEIASAEKELTKATTRLNAVNFELNEALGKLSPNIEATKSKMVELQSPLSLVAKLMGIAAQMARKWWMEGAKARSIVESLRTPLEVFHDQLTELREAFLAGNLGLSLDEFNEAVDRLKQQFIKSQRDPSKEITDKMGVTLRDELRGAGEQGGLALVRGLMQGVFNNATSLMNAIKRVILDIMETIAAILAKRFILPGILGAIGLGPIAAVGGAAGLSRSSAANLAGAGSGVRGLDFSGLNAHPSPLVQARDREWMKIVRATNMQIAAQGG